MLGLLAGTSHADLRSFTHTYEPNTMPAGATAIELWHTQSQATWKADTTQAFEQKIEVEHGITDCWDMAFYTTLRQNTEAGSPGALSFHAASVETRVRLAPHGAWPVDVVMYGELGKDFGASVYEAEGKVLLGREFGNVITALNLIGAVEFGKNVPEAEIELGYALGASYQFSPKVRAGGELFGEVEIEAGELGLSAGPSLSRAPSDKFWVTATAGFGISEAAAFSARILMGLEL